METEPWKRLGVAVKRAWGSVSPMLSLSCLLQTGSQGLSAILTFLWQDGVGCRVADPES